MGTSCRICSERPTAQAPSSAVCGTCWKKRDKNVTNPAIIDVLLRARAGQNTLKIAYFRTFNPLVTGSSPVRPTSELRALSERNGAGRIPACPDRQAENLDPHSRDAGTQSQSGGSAGRKIDDSSANMRTPIVDSDPDRFAIAEVGHLDRRSERQGSVRGRQTRAVVALPARSLFAVEVLAVNRCHAFLRGWRRGAMREGCDCPEADGRPPNARARGRRGTFERGTVVAGSRDAEHERHPCAERPRDGEKDRAGRRDPTSAADQRLDLPIAEPETPGAAQAKQRQPGRRQPDQ